MKYLVSFLAVAWCTALPVAAKDLLSINASFPPVATNVVITERTATNQVVVTNNAVVVTNTVLSNFFQTNFFVFTNTPVATFDMGIGNGKARVTLTVTNLAVNTNYTFLVDGVPQAVFTGNARQKANLVFQNFSTNKARPLTFDPRDSVITVTNGKTFLKLVLGGPAQTPNLRYQESSDLELVSGAGQAEASYDQTKLRPVEGASATNVSFITFRVTLQGVASGTYDVFVDGLRRGSILAKGSKGVIVFESPSGNNDVPLVFDPRGKLVQVRRPDGTVLFSGILRAKGL